MGKIVAVCVGKEKGRKKEDVGKAIIKKAYGILGDGHAGTDREVSLLAIESIDKMKKMGVDVGPGAMAENLTTEGIDLLSLPIGTRLKIGDKVLVKVTQIGKECHDHCEIFKQVGVCVMPTEGIFVKVLNGGEVQTGDSISIIEGE
ncbi:MOSC domain-containing protein [candidate division WOR-3 bacterium]|nr:MOSC domain-containing protein [candidate division WOR-3 bacterium]MCK4575416.1 MOSC domain-containing protein [candidate division WOR-3 bacterium]